PPLGSTAFRRQRRDAAICLLAWVGSTSEESRHYLAAGGAPDQCRWGPAPNTPQAIRPANWDARKAPPEPWHARPRTRSSCPQGGPTTPTDPAGRSHKPD